MQVVYLKKWDQEAGVSAQIGKEGRKSIQEYVTELALRGALEYALQETKRINIYLLIAVPHWSRVVL